MAKRVIKENSETKKDVNENKVDNTNEKPATRNSSLMTLLILLIVFFCINLIVIIYFLSTMGAVDTKSSVYDKPLIDETLKCKDGTPYGECSKDKPLYCFDGELLKKAATCSCPSGYKVDFQDCKKII